MKKIILLAAGFLFVLGVSSCKKDYTCTCYYNGLIYSQKEYTKVKKKDAENSCASLDSQLKALDPNMSCSI